jgi:tetratricopeptide (TPR) repeat protein
LFSRIGLIQSLHLKPPKKKSEWKPASVNPPPMNLRRKWLFRIMALVVVPLALAAALEVGLRISGYGYSPHFFERVRLGEKTFLVNNQNFTRRFFPPQLMRWPGPVMLETPKPKGTYRIFILGESAARGEPEPNYAASRYLLALLSEKFSGTKFEVVNLGITAINSHVILPIARDCAAADGDLWIIYMGNNEMVGPFGAATVFGAKAPPLGLVRFNLALQQLRIGQLIADTAQRLHGRGQNTTWGGMRMFLGNQIRVEDSHRETVYHNFARNLEDIIQAGLESNAKILLNTVAVNLRDCPPFASLTNSALSAAQAAEFQSEFSAATALQQHGDWNGAVKTFSAAEKLDANYPELQFRLAQSLAKAGDLRAAAEHFQKACDVDALPFRANTRINTAIADAGKKYSGERLVFFDAAKELASLASDGVSGQELFYEHVHFNFAGEFALGRAWAAQVEKMLPPEITRLSATNGWASSEVCDARLGLTDWNRCSVTESVMDRLQRPPLAGQLNNAERFQTLQEEQGRLRRRMDTNTAQIAYKFYLDAIQHSPGDALLHENFAEFLESGGDQKTALAAWRQYQERLPFECEGHFQAGRLLGALQQWDESEKELRIALASRPQLVEAWIELGNTHLAGGKPAEAVADFVAAEKYRPTDATCIAMRGRALEKLNRHAEAVACYRRALEFSPAMWEVMIALGDALAAQHDLSGAAKAYADVLRIQPKNKLALLDLGVMHAQTGQMDDAIHEFQTVLELDPYNQQAAEYLQRVQRWKLGQH